MAPSRDITLVAALLGACCTPTNPPEAPAPAAPVVAVPQSPTAAPCTPRARLVAVSLQGAPALDGQLEEWPRPSGSVTQSEPCTLELEVALRDDGLYLAGRGSADSERMRVAPRLELELAFGFPALVFGPPSIENHLGRREIGSAAACADTEAAGMALTPEDIASCQKWLEHARIAQGKLASELIQGFTVETVLGSSGRSFEAFVSKDVLPPVPGYPARELWLRGVLSPGNVAIELPEAAGDCSDCPEQFRGRMPLQVGEAPAAAQATEPTASLPRALTPRPRSWVAALTGELVVHRLGPKVEEVRIYDVPLRAYQYSPELPFPTSRTIRLKDAEEVAALGKIRVLLLEAGNMVGSSTPQALLTLRGEELIDAVQVSDLALKGSVQASNGDGAPALHLLSVAETSQSKLGSGTCGACAVLDVTEVVVRGDGRLQEPTTLFTLHEQDTENRWEFSVASDARSVRIEFEENDQGEVPRLRRHRLTLQWNAKLSQFVRHETLGRWRSR